MKHSEEAADILCLLVNGVESNADLAALAKKFSIGADLWQEMLNCPKPLAFNQLYCVGRMREPATATIINAFANAYLRLFGTNCLRSNGCLASWE